MLRYLCLLFVFCLFFSSTGNAKESLETRCPDGSTITNKQYYPKPGGFYSLRVSPSTDAAKIVNNVTKDMSISDEHKFNNIDESALVLEVCRYRKWSFVQVITPDWLRDSHIGWVETALLMTSEDQVSDKYYGKILEMATSPYTQDQYPKLYSQFQKQLPHIELLRRAAAELAIDNNICDRVTESELTFNNTPKLLAIKVVCENGKNSTFTEKNIMEAKASQFTK